MSHHVACPHCQSLLLVPDNCEGRATKCPQCGGSFLIPEMVAAVPAGTPTASATSRPATTASTIANARTDPPAVSEAEVNRAQQIYEQLTAENVALQLELSNRQRHVRRLGTEVTWLGRFQAGRKMLDQSMGRIGGFFMSITLATALLVMLIASVFSLGPFGYFTWICLGLIAATVAYIPFSFYPDDARLALLIPERQGKLDEARQKAEALSVNEAAHRQRLTAAEQQYQTLRRAFASRMQWLRTVEWQQLNSKSLVTFVTQVLEEHGYPVEPTGKKVQVGIDLVVLVGKERVAVQVKGAQAGPVEQHVVQQTHGSLAQFKCQRGQSITNAKFMPSARQLADQLGCKLIDGSQFPDFVEGRLLL